MARPKIPIDPEMVRQLAAIQCTMGEMAAVLRCSVDTLSDRFSEVIKEGREQGKMSLRRKQYEAAMGGNSALLIWLGKQYLAQSDKQEQVSQHHIQMIQRWENAPSKELLEKLPEAIEVLKKEEEKK